MAGTKIGGVKASLRNKELYGSDFYQRIGAIGGKKSNTGGFHSSVCEGCDWKQTQHRKAECAGARGGKISRRGKAIK